MKIDNLFEAMPDNLEQEFFELLLDKENIKIERIISKGHSSPDCGWYNQQQHEWVVVLKGEATIAFERGEDVNLKVGSYLNIPANTKHKVKWTTPETETVWLAIHYVDPSVAAI